MLSLDWLGFSSLFDQSLNSPFYSRRLRVSKVSNVYEYYKPLRNMMRRCHIEASIVDVWQLSRHILHGGPAPVQRGRQPYSLKPYLYPWDLPTIAREVILHANREGEKRLDSWTSMQTVINAIRRTEGASSGARMEVDDVMQELHRISHRQFPWQQKNDLNGLLRYLKVFGSPEVGPILERTTGFSIREYFLLGMWLTGHLLKRFDINAKQDFTAFGIPQNRSLAFFISLSSTVDELRGAMAGLQRYDESWEYTWNPLEAKPLIALNPVNRERLYCPVPDLLLRRFSHGMYYDLVKSPGFDTAFGASFQNYIGEILHAVFDHTNFTVVEEREYDTREGRHHGADWILGGPDANLFIECKTKRMKQVAKFSIGGPDLAGEIGIIADAVFQLYKNIREAEAGKSTWTPNGLPNFPLVVTLEDWFLFGPLPQKLLKNAVADRIRESGLDPVLIEKMPYAVASAREFERFAGIIEEVGVHAFFSKKSAAEYSGWMWSEYAREVFPAAKRTDIQVLFKGDWLRVIPIEAMSSLT